MATRPPRTHRQAQRTNQQRPLSSLARGSGMSLMTLASFPLEPTKVGGFISKVRSYKSGELRIRTLRPHGICRQQYPIFYLESRKLIDLTDPAGAANIARLHQEILDFYAWVRPQDFEQEIRLDLISRLQKTFSRLEPGCQLKPFGSFAAGLHLPTGDMDLVLMTYGPTRSKSAKSLLWYIHNVLDRQGIAVAGSLQPIAKAKVPIIKFVDAVTGLKVDLSFNNDTGIVANNTFYQWKAQYPAMPILVSVIKQFLMIRGLNDVAFGGLGGFSTICLVTSLLQHLVPSGNMPNLGNLLLNFFHYYGHVFNKQKLAIRLEPPGFVLKVG